VTNIGFNVYAPNTIAEASPLAGAPRRLYEDPIRLYDIVVVDREYNRRCFERATPYWKRS
jgi:hypothetical protein